MSTGSPTSSPSRVLVVEDEPSIRDVVATALWNQGYNVHEVGDGTAALAAATDSAFDLIVHGGGATITGRLPPDSRVAEPSPESR